ncbi:hypothetical protein SAMN04488109_2811 [Chryseolinea serpens]|uniref:Uncharacterized protein n=1 Tax=Chryseolinea serpens TaxID=947013 RepID=A0A1M5PCS3_9BACT|nr:hypothetical protein [Chryseolinea serpens]SHG99570.1 hypothetical protein SAMN04488109_2811 [Chryseolinea serpens]
MTESKSKKSFIQSLCTWTKQHKKSALALAIILASIQFLNFTGFCYSELRYLDRYELLDRFLFGPSTAFTEDEKIQKIAIRGGEYPGCCRITPEKRFLNKILGYYFYNVESHFSDPDPRSSDTPKYLTFSSINSCGTRVIHESGMPETQKSYDASVYSINKSWGFKK